MQLKLLIRDLRAQVRTKPALILGSQIQKSPPYFINLEPTSFCNLKCIICSYDDSRPKGYLDKQTAELALRQAVDLGVTEVRFFLAGEPFFHPHLCEFIRSAKEKGLLTLIHTNGSFLPEDRARKVIDAGLDKISFSLDGEKAEEYESVRIGAKFDHTLNNVIRFLEIKKRKGGKFPLTTIQVIKLPSFINPDNITRTFRGIFRQLPVDEFLLLKPFVWPEQERREFNPAVGCKFYPCMIPWSSLSVGWDGRVFWCCGDLNGKGVLGDIHHNTLREIWNGETMMKIRRGLARGELEDLPLCRNCEALYHHHNPLFSDLRDYWRQIKRAFK